VSPWYDLLSKQWPKLLSGLYPGSHANLNSYGGGGGGGLSTEYCTDLLERISKSPVPSETVPSEAVPSEAVPSEAVPGSLLSNDT
jgi:hypothetical protein